MEKYIISELSPTCKWGVWGVVCGVGVCGVGVWGCGGVRCSVGVWCVVCGVGGVGGVQCNVCSRVERFEEEERGKGV